MAAMADATKEFLADTVKQKPWLKEIDIDQLRIDGGTQQRDVDTSIIEEYAELIKGGSPTPPGWVIYDGKDFWLWSGFHRYFANIKAKSGKMNVYVNKGTVRDAIWLSFSANKEHGVRRSAGVVRDMVAKIWEDAEWSKSPAKAIAEHVGVSTRRIEQILSDLKSSDKAGKRSGGERTVKRGGKQYTMSTEKIGKASAKAAAKAAKDAAANGSGKAQAPEAPPAPEPVTVDMLGAKIKDPGIIDVFTRLPELKAIISRVSAIKVEVARKIEPLEGGTKDPLFSQIHFAGWKGDMENAYADLKYGLPFALCPEHAQDPTARQDCKWCVGTGWVTERNHKLATESRAAATKEKK